MEKGKFDGIFDSLSPVNGLLSGDKVKPVLINSKLPLDVLGRVSILKLVLSCYTRATVNLFLDSFFIRVDLGP